MIRRLALPVACALALLCASHPTRAESDAERATARGLAQQGLALKKQGNCQDALGVLQQAQAIYDAPTHLLAIAQCQAQLGQLVEAAESYRKLGRSELTAKSPPAFRTAQQLGEKELSELVPRIATLILDVSPPNIPGLILRLDGEPLLLQMLGAARPANPGQHTFEAEAPGFTKAQRPILLKEGEKQKVLLPLSKTESTAPIPTSPPSASAVASAKPPPTVSGPVPTSPPQLPPETGSSRKTVGYVVGGVGAVSMLLGTYFGFRAISKKGLRDDCVAPSCSSRDYSDFQTSSDHAATASSAFFGVGLVGLGVGAILVLTAPPELAPATSLRLGPGSIHLAGSFLCAHFPSSLVSSRSLSSRAVAP